METKLLPYHRESKLSQENACLNVIVYFSVLIHRKKLKKQFVKYETKSSMFLLDDGQHGEGTNNYLNQ